MIIHVPNRNIIVTKDALSVCSEMGGFYKIEKLSVDINGDPIEASRTLAADWFPNLITTQGLNRAGTGSWNTACQVGGGSATPAFTDTGLQTFIAGTTTLQSSVTAAQASAPFFGSSTRVYRFAAGVATGNLSEVGVGWLATGSNLFSRALILDGGGNPVTINVLSTEVLDVTYQIRLFVPTDDVTGNFTVTGVGNIGFTARGAFATNNQWAPIGNHTNLVLTVFNGAIGPITGVPSGIQASSGLTNPSAYENNSFQRECTFSGGLNDLNVLNGISSARIAPFEPGWGQWQYGFGTVIPKTAAQTLVLNFSFSWARR